MRNRNFLKLFLAGSLALGAAAALLPSPGYSQQTRMIDLNCSPFKDAVEWVDQVRPSSFVAAGLVDGRGTITMLYVNSETGAWKILDVLPDGSACVFAFGEFWGEIPEPPLPTF